MRLRSREYISTTSSAPIDRVDGDKLSEKNTNTNDINDISETEIQLPVVTATMHYYGTHRLLQYVYESRRSFHRVSVELFVFGCIYFFFHKFIRHSV